jgi:hypothetical protein
MAIKYKVLGQSLPIANTLTDLYTVPASNSAVISTLTVCNTTLSNVTFRVAVRPKGNAITTQQYIAYDVPLPAQDSIPLTLGVTMDATDVMTVYTFQGNVSFNLFGSEIY